MKISKVKDRDLYKCSVRLPNKKYKVLYGKTKRECREKAEALLFKLKSGNFVEDSNILFQDWCRQWYDHYLINVGESTRKMYSRNMEQIIIPYFSEIKLQSITHNLVQTFVQDLTDRYSPKSVKNITSVLHRCLNDAVRNGYISFNPSENLIMPKQIKTEMCVLDLDEVKEFIKIAYEIDSEYADCFEFLLHTGLRLGEFIGLTIDSYNRKNGTITIDKQFHERQHEFTPPKHDVIRTFGLTNRAIEIIENRLMKIENRRKDYPAFNKENYLFLNPENERIKPTTFRKHIKKIAEKIKKPDLRVHDLRHTFATITLASGTNAKTLQKRLGHSDVIFTMNKYAHSTEIMDKYATDNLNTFFQS